MAEILGDTEKLHNCIIADVFFYFIFFHFGLKSLNKVRSKYAPPVLVVLSP